MSWRLARTPEGRDSPQTLPRALWGRAARGEADDNPARHVWRAAGTLAATNIVCVQIAAFIFAPIGSMIYDASGVGTLSTVSAATVAIGSTPCILYIAQFTDGPSRGPFGRPQEAVPSEPDAKDPTVPTEA